MQHLVPMPAFSAQRLTHTDPVVFVEVMILLRLRIYFYFVRILLHLKHNKL